jgi:hypothetical protein
LSRDIANDLANSPPDLGHRFETFGKSAGASLSTAAAASSSTKFDTFSGKSGITKSADNLDKPTREKSKFDTFSGTIDDHEIRPELPMKKNQKSKPKRKPLSVDTYEIKSSSQMSFDSGTQSRTQSLREQPIKESFRESLHPAIFQLDKSKAVLRDKLHEELRSKYGGKDSNNKKLLKAKPPKVPSINHRPPLKSQNPNDSFLKVQSNDSLNVKPVPSPRKSQPSKYSEDDDDDDPDPMYAAIQPKNKSPRPQHHNNSSNNSNSMNSSGIQLGRLSKEDLLSLTTRTESEIHEFLNGGKTNNNNNRIDPP